VQAINGVLGAAGAHFDDDPAQTYHSHKILPMYPGQHPNGLSTLGDRPGGTGTWGVTWKMTVAADYQIVDVATGVYSDCILGCVYIQWFDSRNECVLKVWIGGGPPGTGDQGYWRVAETDRRPTNIESIQVSAKVPDKLWNDAKKKWDKTP
jgi:hypothetical protein